MAQELYWIWLAELCGAGSPIPTTICNLGFTAKDVYDGALESVDLSDMDESKRIAMLDALGHKDLTEAEQILAKCASGEITVITPESELYPDKLRSIGDMPAVLYVRGKMPVSRNRMHTAVVGTRTMSDYGRKTAYALGAGLAFGGSHIVSGMALGADSMAIIGAMEAGGTVIAVLGSGADVIYPREHRDLYAQILKNGAVISEFRPGTPPAGRHFPIRNRIMSGLADATVVVEAGEKSGALITARLAVKQGRTLFAVPGRVGDPGSEGTNQLICDGAVPATTAEDILSEFQFVYEKTVSVDRAHTMLHGLDMETLSKNAMTKARISSTESRGQFYGKGSYGGKYKDSIPQKITETLKTNPQNATEKPAAESVKAEQEAHRPEKSGVAAAAKSIIEAVFAPIKENSHREREKQTVNSEEKMVPARKIELDVLDETEIKVYNKMKPSVPVMPDSLVDDTLKIGDVLSALTVLEMAGAVESGGGGYYMRVQPDDIMQSIND